MAKASRSTRKNTNVLLITLGALVAVMLVFATTAFLLSDASSPSNPSIPSLQTEVVPGNASDPTTVELLTYLIEEEKLAHDVYTKMYELWGARVFGNILQSESTHQDEVLRLLMARGVADPRTDTIGTFNNAGLQAFYNQLIAQGSQSAAEAYKVGVAIEEKDIADINTQLKTASDTDVITVLEKLRRGSENHLRAFNRQI
jgi:hypothetical protein